MLTRALCRLLHLHSAVSAPSPSSISFRTLLTRSSIPEKYSRRSESWGQTSARTRIPPTVGMTEMIVKILVELLSILASATKQLQQGKLSESVLGEILYYLTMLAGRPYAINANFRAYLAGQVAQAALRAGGFIYSFSSLSVQLEVSTVREEEVGGVETHAIDILKPHTNKVVVSSQRQMATTTTLTT
jgi:hypothetical protein